MSLNITNLLNTLQGFYDPQKGKGKKYTGAEEGLSSLISASGLTGVTNEELTEDNLSKNIIGSSGKVTVSSLVPAKFSYKIDETGKIIILGNNLTITVDENNQDLVEIVGISNEIKGTSKADNITLYGYDNTVDASEEKDNVTIYGKDNEIKDSEVNIFSGIGGNYLLYDDKEFLVSQNEKTNETSSLTIGKTDSKITLEGSNVKIIAQDDVDDEITLKGNKNYLDTSEGADNINVIGDDNIVVTGTDNDIDTINIDGKGNRIVGGSDDFASYTATSGSVVLTAGDESSHTITLKDSQGVEHNFSIHRKTDYPGQIEVSYELNENDEFVFTCENARICSPSSETESSKIKIAGNNNEFTSVINGQEISIEGNNNAVISGEGKNIININGSGNQILGDEDNEVYYTSNSGSVCIGPNDKSQHYIKIGDLNYEVKRNEIEEETEDRNITLDYKMSELGVLEITGDYFRLTQQNDDIADNISLTGSYNTVDTGEGDDKIEITGNSNIAHGGEGDDTFIVVGDNNEIYGDAGNNGAAIKGEGNIQDNIQNEDKIIILKNEENEFESTFDFDGKKYTVEMSDAAKEEGKEIKVYVQYRNGEITVEADDVVVTAGKGQADKINFIGNNSKIFAQDKDDIINVKGNDNYIDGWTGNDKITATGKRNQALGFLGNDEINMIQTEVTEDEVLAEYEKIDADENNKTKTVDEKFDIAVKNTKEKNNVNKIDGEFGVNTVKNASYYTEIKNVQNYMSLHNKIEMDANEKNKKIIVDNKTYTINNYITYETNNPFKVPRTISYELVDVEVNGEITKQLVVQGDYIEVVADDGQNDNIKVIGQYNYVDMKDGDDYLYTKGNYNMLLGGFGKDKFVVNGSNNTIQGNGQEDSLEFEGDSNDNENSVWSDIEHVSGKYKSTETLTNSKREKVITVDDKGTSYTIKANVADDEEMENIKFSYAMVDGVLKITGDKIHIIAKSGQADNIELLGDDCIIELGDKNDIISAKGARNEIHGGKGNDAISIYGESFKVFGEDGKDNIELRAINSSVYAGNEKSNASYDDKLTVYNTDGNTYKGFRTTNIKNDDTKGIVVLDAQRQSGEIKFKDLDGSQIIYKVTHNVSLPENFADKIYVDYEIVELKDENGKVVGKQLVLNNANGITVNLTKSTNKSVYAQIIGSNNRFETYGGDDIVVVEGDNNYVSVGEGISQSSDGENVVYVKGNSNEIHGGKNIDEFTVEGNNNVVIGGGEKDKILLDGEDNNFKVYEDGTRQGGSITLSNENSTQNIVIKGKTEAKDRAYKVAMYNAKDTQILVQYYIDEEGQITFIGDNISIKVIDDYDTPTTEASIMNNSNTLRLVGNNCYISGGYGNDILKIKGDNNIADGWYGDDSIILEEGNGNELRGFDGNDSITITKGDNNKVNGEEGYNTLDVFEGEENTYENIDKYNKK